MKYFRWPLFCFVTVQLQVKVETLKEESRDLSSLIHENASRLQAVEGNHQYEREEWKKSERDYENRLKKVREEKQRMQAIQGELHEEQDDLRTNASQMQQLMLEQKQEYQGMYHRVQALEEQLSSSMRNLQVAQEEIAVSKDRENLQAEQLQAVILARNENEQETVEAKKKL